MSVWPAIWLTLQLATVTTGILLIIALPYGWWLATTKARTRPLFEAITALPLVLPPTVLGFYLLILMRPDAPFGGFFLRMTGETLAFSFTGLVIASVTTVRFLRPRAGFRKAVADEQRKPFFMVSW